MTTAIHTLHAELGTSHRQGRRALQQDAVIAGPELIAVADGFGERDDLAGAALAAFAAGGLEEAVALSASDVTAALPGQPTSGTTLTAVVLDGATARITHIGDARVWLVRDGEVRQVTHDHTIVAGLLEAGQLSPDEARSHEHRNLLNRALAPGVVADEHVRRPARVAIASWSPRTGSTPGWISIRCSSCRSHRSRSLTRSAAAVGGGGARQPHDRRGRPELMHVRACPAIE